MIQCELCDNKIRVSPEIAPPDYNFQIDGWAFCQDCKIKLLRGISE